MPLEAGDGFISGLVATNPVNATDQVAQGDDHIRLIKAALLGSFPGVTGAVTATHTELNALDGITASVAELNILDGVTASTAELNILDGVTLTAAQINDAALKAASNTFTGAVQAISATGADAVFLATRVGGVSVEVSGSSSYGIYGTTSNHPVAFVTNSTTGMEISAAGNFDFKDGTVTSDNASASEVGFKGLPTATDETPVLTDAGKIILATTNITIPANGSVAFPVGTVLPIYNTTAGSINITVTTDTLVLAAVGTITTGTLAAKGLATVTKVASTTWVLAGVGAGGS